jgi:hypothetical protein
LDCLGLQEGHTLEQFLKSLEDKFCELSTGEDGDDGDSAYQIWLNLGNVGTEQDFIDSLAGEDGDDGVDGTLILATYNDLTGVGNQTTVGEDVLFTHIIPANTLVANGDELEIFTYIEYSNNDSVDLIFRLGVGNEYVHNVISADDETRIIKIKVSRITATSQLWTIEALVNNALSGEAVQTLTITNTTFNLNGASTFEIIANNAAPGANQVVLKKATLYRHKL